MYKMIQSLNSKVVWKVIFIEKWSSPIETKATLELTLTKTVQAWDVQELRQEEAKKINRR